MVEKIQIVVEYLPLILWGAVLTIELALLSLLCALVLGLVGAIMLLSQRKPLRWAAVTYSTVVRGVPDLVWMLLLFYGVQLTVNDFTAWAKIAPVEISSFIAGVVTLSIIFGAYFAETFRGAILAVPHGLIEAGHSYGMTPWIVFSRITFPLLMRFALPGVRNNWQVLVKSTALVSIIGLDDMVRAADMAGGAKQASFLFNLVVAFLFLLITSASLAVFRYLEERYNRGIRVESHGN